MLHLRSDWQQTPTACSAQAVGVPSVTIRRVTGEHSHQLQPLVVPQLEQT